MKMINSDASKPTVKFMVTRSHGVRLLKLCDKRVITV